MNDLDTLTRRLDELGRRVPVPDADPLLDIRRGRAALLRRRRARNATAIATTVLAVGAAVVVAPLLTGPGGAPVGEPALRPAASPSAAAPSEQAASVLCPQERVVRMDGQQALDDVRVRHDTGDGVGHVYGPGMLPKPWKDPVIGPVLNSYRQVIAEILDPSGRHLDRKVTNVQSACGESGLTSLGTKLGWRSGDTLGMVQVEVVAPRRPEGSTPTSEAAVPQIVMGHDQWVAYDGALPAGVRKARVAEDGSGNAVVVERADGLTVAVDAAGVWGNNAAPGSPAASDLPPVEELLALAASHRLVLP